MKIIQSYTQSNDSKKENLKFYIFLINFINLKRFNFFVTMYCDREGYNNIIKYIPYDQVIIIENEYDDPLLYKIQIIEQMKEDFIYINPEFILLNNIFNNINTNKYDLIVNYTNIPENFGINYLVEKNKNCLLNILDITNYDNKYFSTDILGMNLKIKEKYISILNKVKTAINNNEIIGVLDYGYKSLFLEELLIYLIAKSEKLKYTEIIPFNDIVNLKLTGCANKYNFTFLINEEKYNLNNIKIIKNNINKKHNEFYYLINKFENKKYENKKYKLSFCISSMNRVDFLKKTLLPNLELIRSLSEKYNIELVLLNYDSNDDIDNYLNQDIFKNFIDDKFLIYKKVINKEFFHRTNARNIAYLAATGDILCNSDVDCYLSEELIKETYDAFIEYGLDNIIFHGSTNYNFGYICLSKHNFNLLEGYNENLYYYGAEDYDILIRFCLKTKNKIKNLEKNYLNLIINHDDSYRSSLYDKWTTNFVNSIMIYYNLKNNITNPNNGIYGQDEHIKIKDVFNYQFFKKYVLNDEEIINIWNDIKNINNDNWLNHKIMKKFNNFLENNCLNHKIIEVTTMVGCKNITVDIWKNILKNIDKNVEIQFSGFAENFMNPNFPDILKYTYENGYKITIYTTLEGYSEAIDLTSIEINNLYFYEYNGKKFNKDIFYNNVDNFLSKNNIINYHGVLKIGEEEEFTRANNNDRKQTEHKLGKIKCNFGKDFLWQQNNLLLNGDVYICCQDWGLKHKIGNLKNDNLYSNNINDERLKLEKLQLMEDSDIICRDCEFSKKI